MHVVGKIYIGMGVRKVLSCRSFLPCLVAVGDSIPICLFMFFFYVFFVTCFSCFLGGRGYTTRVIGSDDS